MKTGYGPPRPWPGAASRLLPTCGVKLVSSTRGTSSTSRIRIGASGQPGPACPWLWTRRCTSITVSRPRSPVPTPTLASTTTCEMACSSGEIGAGAPGETRFASFDVTCCRGSVGPNSPRDAAWWSPRPLSGTTDAVDLVGLPDGWKNGLRIGPHRGPGAPRRRGPGPDADEVGHGVDCAASRYTA